ncbi:MAG: hypothetical protein CfP315_0899 [Candidatus Improbicoccus pseudotrichonymphae]|uniref:Uncharacterized protein n=1 Tax=Candidatus Improbicoccus pseudotrichonymphae TaxID=3033792 RepID=A0AA48IB75_9FIRM|nr:MAG: hypothetical protein CfP315_0899 [Candidatus Improbicoccus pseudotrichonymphae]
MKKENNIIDKNNRKISKNNKIISSILAVAMSCQLFVRCGGFAVIAVDKKDNYENSIVEEEYDLYDPESIPENENEKNSKKTFNSKDLVFLLLPAHLIGMFLIYRFCFNKKSGDNEGQLSSFNKSSFEQPKQRQEDIFPKFEGIIINDKINDKKQLSSSNKDTHNDKHVILQDVGTHPKNAKSNKEEKFEPFGEIESGTYENEDGFKVVYAALRSIPNVEIRNEIVGCYSSNLSKHREMRHEGASNNDRGYRGEHIDKFYFTRDRENKLNTEEFLKLRENFIEKTGGINKKNSTNFDILYDLEIALVFIYLSSSSPGGLGLLEESPLLLRKIGILALEDIINKNIEGNWSNNFLNGISFWLDRLRNGVCSHDVYVNIFSSVSTNPINLIPDTIKSLFREFLKKLPANWEKFQIKN